MQRPPVRSVLVASLAFLAVLAAATIVFIVHRHRARAPAPPVTFANRMAPSVLYVTRAMTVPRPPDPTSTPSPDGETGAPCAAEPPIVLRERAPLPKAPAELVAVFRADPASLGSAVIGSPTRGSLLNAVALRQSEGIALAGNHPFGTESVVRAIERGIRQVRRCHPNTQRITVGDISKRSGGWLSPHRSHQAGLDADIGYYYTTGPAWFQHATRQNLDVKRTWALMRALIDGGNVEMIFVDRGVQMILREHVATLPEEAPRLGDLFESPLKKDAMLRHAWGHATHFHVRFRDPESVALGLTLQRVIPRVELQLATTATKAATKAGRKPPPPRRPQAQPRKPAPASKQPPKKPPASKQPPKR